MIKPCAAVVRLKSAAEAVKQLERQIKVSTQLQDQVRGQSSGYRQGSRAKIMRELEHTAGTPSWPSHAAVLCAVQGQLTAAPAHTGDAANNPKQQLCSICM